MLKLTWLLTVGLALSIVSTACAPATSEPARTAPPPLPTLPAATPLPTHEPASVGVPAFEYPNQRTELRVVSSVTGKPLEEFVPIVLTPNYSYAFSPDGKTLALLSAAQLYLIDLASWKYRTTDVGLHGLPGNIVYSPDGARLGLASTGPDSNLEVIDTRSGEVKASVQTGYSITNARFTSDGAGLMIYGPHLADSGVAANAGVTVGAPRAALFDTSDLSLRWSVELNGVRAGVFPKKAGTGDTEAIYQPGAAWHYDPGIAFAPDRDALYVVHGDEDKLTTVDFTARRVKTVRIRAKLGWLDQLLALTAGVAYAKGMDGTSKQALISPDGKYLYVVGSTETVTMLAKGNNWDVKFTPLGLSVIAAEDGTLVDKVDTQASSATLSPDGMHIVLNGWNDNFSTPWTDVYDTSSRSILKHIADVSLLPTRRIDGQVLLASTNYISDSFCAMASVNPETWAIISNWKGDCIGWLTNP